MSVLVVNAGGVSLELTVVDEDHVVEDRYVEAWDGHDAEPIADLANRHRHELTAIGHRVVHGGHRFSDPVVVDDDVLEALLELEPLAPLHQRRAVEAMRVAGEVVEDRPHVACFDTEFHRHLPPAATTYPLPRTWRARWPIRRYGFHGSSHAHVARRAPRLAGTGPGARIVSCHLGSGASLCAIVDGRSVDTTMGFTPSEGLVMNTRSGSVDPGLILWLASHAGVGIEEIDRTLREESGLRGLAGGTGDMRDVLERAHAGDEDACVAIDVYIHHLRKHIGAMAAVLGGIDVLAFTGGIGQHLPTIRGRAAAGLAHLGVVIDPDRDLEAEDDRVISTPDSPAAVVVVAGGEHLVIAAATRALTRGARADSPGGAPDSRRAADER
ncbi:acetate/propionate family kinase [Ilumatobacter sp.]|uniref:acetate/propionate family kinase n=1 Tax=Ilumatobacter sp. TaxID=1967498 RepID=UPI003B52B804